LVIYIL
jgi:hypothetical protein